MTEIEYQAYKLVRKKDWYHAIEIFDQIINSGLYSQIPKDRIVSCLLGRSECNLELGQHEAVIADCRSIIKLLADGNESNFKIRARKRLLHSLFFLRRFSELETETRELLLSGGKIKDNIELLKLLERLSSVLHMASNQKGNGIPLENEFKELESHFEALVSQDEFIKYKKAPDNLEYNQFKNEFTNNEMPLIMTDTIVCSYCCITFSTKSDLLAHCQSETHQNVIMSDEGRDWKWRPPPRGFKADTYTLCESFMDNSVCRYGAQCVEAHGPEELAEWKERFKYRRMKLQRAYEKELYGKSYTERLLEKWVAAPSPDKVMKEKVDDVEDVCNKELATTVSSKSSKTEWMFVLKTNKMLKAVALLQDAHRTHFALRQIILGIKKNIKDKSQEIELNSDQEWYSKIQIEEGNDTADFIEHHVKVSFSTDIYGTFRQSIVFDFGSEPVLVKHLCVDVLPAADIDKLKDINKELVLLNTERWYSENSEIVGFTSTIIPSKDINEIERENNLQMTYPFPNLDKFILTQSTIMEKKLTKNNYRARMHELLYVEEVARYEQVARYNLTSKLRITRSYLLSPSGVASTTAKYSHSGELFALMTLGKNVSEDTSAGRLILNNCTTVLLTADASKRKHDEKLKVYEALIEDKGKNVIYLRLSSLTVKELAIKPDVDYLAEIQFQLNRIPYCEWHLAIDKIADFSLIFPDTYLEPSIPWSPQRQWSDKMDAKLNLKQKEAIVAITTPVNIPLPPILIIGPFGTGKTYTLAQAIKQLLTQQDTRILICTHSNSAADLYIKDYIHPYVEAGHEEARPLRIYYHKRWVMTVNQTVQKYCLIDTSENVRNFRIPTLEDIFKTRIVVVTLSTSMYLSTLGLPKGYFTHILLDEAAQAMECEAIMPLALADNTTRIVLAGDHMQLSPELFSQFAKERQLHLSLLERLYDHYPSHYPCKILLCENYRAHEAIVQFTSELFYEQKLICSGKQPRHDKFYPLTFFTTRGEDVQDQNSTAYYNDSEVYEIVERVCELKKHWPSAWGKMDEHSVGIMTPYADQVFRIRSALRKRRMGGISVERVLNVQGKQFRAVFLSTVRTRRTCVNSKMSVDEMDYGFLSNLKLLNTAITRAQSLVAVVGDPVALCSIGRCRKVWERFISICNENRSLFGISWSLLRNQLDGVELKKTYVLNPLAPEFIPRKYQIESYIKMPPVAENSKTNDYAYPTASLKTTDNPVSSPFVGSAPIYSFPSMYYYQPPNQQSTVPFFPLPPLQSNILQTGPLQLNSLHNASLQSGLLPSNPLLQSGPMKSNSGMLPAAPLQNNTMQSNQLHMDALQSNPLQVGPLQTLQPTSLQSLNSGQLQSNTIHPNLLQSNGLQLGPLQTGPNLQSGPLSSNSLQTVSMQPTSLQTGHLQLGPLHSNSLQQNSLQSAHLQSTPLQLGPLQSNSLSQGPLPSGPLQLNPLQSVHLTSNAMQSNSLQQNHIPFSSSAAAVMGPWSLNCPQIPTNTSIPGWPPKIPVSNTDLNDGTNIQRNNVVTPLLRFPDVQYPNNMITNSQNPASLQQLNTLQQQLDRYTGETYIPRDTFIRNPQQTSNLLIGNKLIEPVDVCPIDKNQIPYLNNIDLQPNIPVPNSQNMIYPQTVSLLPPDMNVIDMLKRPQSYQIEWYLHLKNMNGISTANKFLELLISAKKQQEQIMCTNYPQLIDNVVEKPNVYTPLPNGYSSPNIKPLCADMSRMNMQPPNYIDEQRILNSKPLILKDLELPYTEGSRIFVDRFPDVLDQIQQSFQSRPVQNIPLYKRQSMLNSSTSNNVDQKIQKQIPASSTNNHSEYSQHSQIENRNMPVYDNFMQQHLIPEPQQPEQIRINSNDLQNKELLDEVANRQTTYASVLRTNALPNKVDLGRNDLFARDLGQIPSSRNSTGLYQYFS